jgi:SH3-like domain-containing protein
MMRRGVILLFSVVALTGCGPTEEPAIDQATVTARFAAVRQRNSSTAPTILTLEPGDHIEILEKQGDWYRVRIGDRQGWMQHSTIVTTTTQARIQEAVTAAQGQIPQNTATLASDGNLRVEPGRATEIVRRLPSGTPVEVLDRVTLPRKDSPGKFDVWLKVRPAPAEVGWMLSSLLQFSVPPEIAQYTEDRTYAAVKTLTQVEDNVAGVVHWYIVGERRAGYDPHLDFEGIRVFTWNQRKQRYETAYRIALRGLYPLEVSQDEGRPAFRVHELAEDGKTKVARNFVLNGVVVQEKK